MNKNPLIVQIAGRKGAGKTYLTTILFDYFSKEGYRIYKTSFAAKLKSYLRKLGITKYKATKIIPYDEFHIKLYEILCDIFIFDENGELSDKLNKYSKEIENAYKIFFIEKKYNLGFRKFAQIIGTEIIRSLDENIWVKQVVMDIQEVKDAADIVLIDDWRFPNEDLAKYYDNVLRILLVNKINSSNDDHISETSVNLLEHDLYIERFNNKYDPNIDKILCIVENKLKGGEK